MPVVAGCEFCYAVFIAPLRLYEPDGACGATSLNRRGHLPAAEKLPAQVPLTNYTI